MCTQKDKKTQSEEMEQSWEPDSHALNYQTLTMINILKDLKEKVDSMQDQIGKFSREIETMKKNQIKMPKRDFPGGPVVKNLPSNAGDTGSISGWELRSHMPQSN